MGPQTRIRKLLSLSVVPLGAFVLFHLWTTAALLESHTLYERQVSYIERSPLVRPFAIVFVLVPLAFHTIDGLWRWVRKLQRDEDRNAYGTPMKLLLERISGIAVLLFVTFHLWETRTWRGQSTLPGSATRLVEHLSSANHGIPWIALGYLVGTGATIFHLVNGFTSVCATWGLAQAPRQERAARVILRAFGILLYGITTATIIQLAAGAWFATTPSYAPNTCGTAAPPTASVGPH